MIFSLAPKSGGEIGVENFKKYKSKFFKKRETQTVDNFATPNFLRQEKAVIIASFPSPVPKKNYLRIPNHSNNHEKHHDRSCARARGRGRKRKDVAKESWKVLRESKTFKP